MYINQNWEDSDGKLAGLAEIQREFKDICGMKPIHCGGNNETEFGEVKGLLGILGIRRIDRIKWNS